MKPEKKTQPSGAALTWSGLSDRGKVRANNEDSFLGLRFDAREAQRLGKFGTSSLAEADFVFAVSDGMGGAKAGEYASQIAVDKITTRLPRSFRKLTAGSAADAAEILTPLFREIHRALAYLGDSYDECRGMETTMSLAWFTPGWAYFGHIGDSRIYHLPAGKNEIHQLTEDDTHVGWLLRTGQINEREARHHPRRHVLQKALGGGNQFVDPQIGAVPCAAGDIFLLCTDGLVEGLHDHHLAELLRAAKFTDKDSSVADQLVAESLKNSGRDNTTALVVRTA